MSRLISFLGKNDYSPTTYISKGRGELKTPFVAAAIAKLWQVDEIRVLVTMKAKESNGQKLQQELRNHGCPEAEFIDIPSGKSPEELWQLFDQTRHAISDDSSDDIILDITHGFRSQPFFAAAVLSFLRAVDRMPNDLRVLYGAYDAKVDDKAPIWDLSLFVELLDWTYALHLFMRTGNADAVVRLGDRTRRKIAKEHNRGSGEPSPKVEKLVKAIERFALDLATVRIPHLLIGYEQDAKRKPKSSAEALLQAIEECRQDAVKHLPLLAEVLGEMQQWVKDLPAKTLAGDRGHAALSKLAKLYLNLNRYPEAAITVREGWICRLAEASAADVGRPGFSRQERGHVEESIATENLWRSIADVRNDIEHGGFREQPLAATKIRKNVERMVQEFDVDVCERGLNRPRPRVRSATWFVSRHPGAVEWAERRGLHVDRQVEHLDISRVQAGDTVIGTLPVHLAAEVCARGADYLHLSLDMPPEWRGRELSADAMEACRARIERYEVRRID